MQLSSEQPVSRLRTNFFKLPICLVFRNVLRSAGIMKVCIFNRFGLTNKWNFSANAIQIPRSLVQISLNRKVRICKNFRNFHCLLNKNPCPLNPKRNAMAVAVNYMRTDPKIVQHGVRHAGNVISLIIGKLFVARFQRNPVKEDQAPW